MRYPHVLLDLDHTLIDSDAAERGAFEVTMRSVGVPDPHEYADTYFGINKQLWAAVEQGEMQPETVRNTRFEQFVAAIDIDADYLEMSATYSTALSAQTELFAGARLVLEEISSKARLAMVTNGLSDVQRTRIARLDLEQYFDAIVISAEIGHTKPGREIFDIAFEQLGLPDRDMTLMVGDSLSSDIRGGVDYGIDTCWYNPGGAACDGVVPTFVIDRLELLPGLVEVGRV